jgi:hypothetical protein
MGMAKFDILEETTIEKRSFSNKYDGDGIIFN